MSNGAGGCEGGEFDGRACTRLLAVLAVDGREVRAEPTFIDLDHLAARDEEALARGLAHAAIVGLHEKRAHGRPENVREGERRGGR